MRAGPAWRLAATLACALALGSAARAAESGPAGATLLRDLRTLRTVGTVLHVGAHPDDENTELITWLSLGRGYRTAYLSVTRGDGGQNELGRDFDEKLGVLRTEELLAARRLDHGRQFFTRAVDFGFSKSPEEALRLWDRAAVLGDVVRVIRQFRPDVIVSRFPIPPGSGGHGQHTASAMLAVEAFQLAGNPDAYPEQLREGLQPWQPRRVLWNAFRFGAAGPGPLNFPVIKQDIGGTDPVSGEEFGTIAARSRAMHRTQGLAGAVNRARTGPNEQSFMILAGDAPTADLMDGVDATWSRFPGGAAVTPLIDAAIAGFNPDDPSASVPALLALRRQIDALGSGDPVVREKRADLDRLIAGCLGLSVATTLTEAEVVAGETFPLRLQAWREGTQPVRWVAVRYPGLGQTLPVDADLPTAGPLVRATTPRLPDQAPLTQPYWLRHEGSTGLFQVDDNALIGRPRNPSVFPVEYVFSVAGEELTVADEPHTLVPGVPREMARPLTVIPPVSLALNSSIYLIAPGATKQVTLTLTAARDHANGRLQLAVPAGWTLSTGPQAFHLPRRGDQAAFTFAVTAPAGGGDGRLEARVEMDDGRTWSTRRLELAYAHLPPQLLQPPARARLASFPLATKGSAVGYVPGAGDSLDECLEQMGYVVHHLTGADLTPEKLHGLDAVVIGVRAFNDRDDLRAAMPGLLAWVEQGGTVIAQYNRTDRALKTPELGPYPITIQEPAPRQRVTDENAPVTVLVPDHAAVNAPNKITPADFAGWVQERGTYFPAQWDEEHYAALFAMSDPGEPPLKGGLLVARHGRGHYVYTGLAFFRQLPAGVPGAYHLFANLLALGP